MNTVGALGLGPRSDKAKSGLPIRNIPKALLLAMNNESIIQLGMIGLGRMGANMVRRLIIVGHPCVVFGQLPEAVEALAKHDAVGASSFAELVKKTR
jgi:hypothetical protein